MPDSMGLRGEIPKELFFYITRYVFCYWDKRLHMWAKSQANCKLIYSTVHHSVTSCNPLMSRINSPGDPLHPCLRTGNWHYYEIFKPESSRSRELEDGAPLLRRDSQPVTRKCTRRAAALQPPVRQRLRSQQAPRTGAWPWILVRIWAAGGAQTQLGKDSTFNHKISSLSHTSSEPQKGAKTRRPVDDLVVSIF